MDKIPVPIRSPDRNILGELVLKALFGCVNANFIEPSDFQDLFVT